MITETPTYVRDGLRRIDELIVDRIYGRGDDYGYMATSNTGQVHELPGAPFQMRAFSWADCENESSDETGFENNENTPWYYCEELDCRGCAPQFYHPRTGLKLWWYKHVNRIPEANQQLSYEAWRNIQRECEDWILSQETTS